MTSASLPGRLIVSALVMLPALGGCQGSPSAKFYTLASRPGPLPAASFSKTITVKRVEVAKYLDRPQIVRHYNPYGLSLAEFDRWGEGLGDMVTRVLVENLTQRLPRSQIYAATSPLTSPTADMTVEVNIDSFEPDSGGAVILAAQWVVHYPNGSARFRSQRIRVEPTGGAPKGDATNQIVAMSDALGDLATDIAATVATQPKRTSPSKAAAQSPDG